LLAGGIMAAGSGILGRGLSGAAAPTLKSTSRTIGIQEDMIQIRHHTGPEQLKGIWKDGFINASRSIPRGVDFEVAPFRNVNQLHLGNANKGSYVQMTVPKSLLSPLPGYLGGVGNAARIVTNGAALPIRQFNPTFVKRAWLGW